jgi:predicted PurR-regulated permease PerM
MIVQAIENNVSQPLIFATSVNSHPLEIFIITIISGLLMGITGMIIAVPLYTIIKVFAKEFYPNNKIVWLFTRKL